MLRKRITHNAYRAYIDEWQSNGWKKDVVFTLNTALVAGTNDDVSVLEHGVVVGIGAVHIAENVTIGANVVVNKDVVESNIAVAGVPAHKVINNGSTTWKKIYKYMRLLAQRRSY